MREVHTCDIVFSGKEAWSSLGVFLSIDLVVDSDFLQVCLNELTTLGFDTHSDNGQHLEALTILNANTIVTHGPAGFVQKLVGLFRIVRIVLFHSRFVSNGWGREWALRGPAAPEPERIHNCVHIHRVEHRLANQ